MKVGDKIRLKRFIMGMDVGNEEYNIEEFRYCLGFFESENHRVAGKFTPLCSLYKSSPDSKNNYISNFGEYVTNMVPSWDAI